MENEKEIKKICLVKMGMDYTEESDQSMTGSDVGNYRIRGTFHDCNGDLIFIEFGNCYKYLNHKPINRIGLRIDHQFNTTKSWDENKSHIKINYKQLEAYNYTKHDILKYIKNKFGVKFDELILIDSTICDYEYREIAGDEFQPDTKAIKQAQKIKDYFYKFEKKVEGKKYPNLSTYFENHNYIVLKHYNEYNVKLLIDDIYEFDFDYKTINFDNIQKHLGTREKNIYNNLTYLKRFKTPQDYNCYYLFDNTENYFIYDFKNNKVVG